MGTETLAWLAVSQAWRYGSMVGGAGGPGFIFLWGGLFEGVSFKWETCWIRVNERHCFNHTHPLHRPMFNEVNFTIYRLVQLDYHQKRPRSRPRVMENLPRTMTTQALSRLIKKIIQPPRATMVAQIRLRLPCRQNLQRLWRKGPHLGIWWVDHQLCFWKSLDQVGIHLYALFHPYFFSDVT